MSESKNEKQRNRTSESSFTSGMSSLVAIEGCGMTCVMDYALIIPRLRWTTAGVRERSLSTRVGERKHEPYQVPA